MNDLFHIGEDDLNPALQVICTDDKGAVVPLDDAASVAFFMINPGVETPEVNGSAAVFVDKPAGIVEYRWVAGDVDTPGVYDAHFVVTWNDGKKTTFPNSRFITVKIKKKIGS